MFLGNYTSWGSGSTHTRELLERHGKVTETEEQTLSGKALGMMRSEEGGNGLAVTDGKDETATLWRVVKTITSALGKRGSKTGLKWWEFPQSAWKTLTFAVSRCVKQAKNPTELISVNFSN